MMRSLLFLFGALAALAWWHRRPKLSAAIAVAGGLAGLSFWLIQVTTPLGLGTDPRLTREWAQAGVNASGGALGQGYVWGTDSETSLVSTLAVLGIPLRILHLVPQLAVLLGLGLIVVLPFVLWGSRKTSALAVGLALGGGLWPGVSPYDALLRRPALLLAFVALAALVTLACRRKTHPWSPGRPGLLLGLLAGAALDTSGILPVLASMLLVPGLRAVLRRMVRSADLARRLEAGLLLGAFAGSGLTWWSPPHTVKEFRASAQADTALRKPLSWLALHVPPNEVILSSPAYSAFIAAYTGHRVLYPPSVEDARLIVGEPFRRARLLDSTLRGAPVTRLAEAFSVTHFLRGPGEPDPPALPGAGTPDEPRMSLVLVYQDAEDFRVFRLAKK